MFVLLLYYQASFTAFSDFSVVRKRFLSGKQPVAVVRNDEPRSPSNKDIIVLIQTESAESVDSEMPVHLDKTDIKRSLFTDTLPKDLASLKNSFKNL